MRHQMVNSLHHEVIPGILEQEWSAIEKKINLVKPFAKIIHIDLIDGIFAPNKTWMDPEPFRQYTNDSIFELHMMVDNPLQYIKPFAAAGFQRFIGHIEKMPDVEEFVAQAQLAGEVALGLDITTFPEEIKISLDDLDFLFMMTTKAGYSRQTFLPEILEKVKAIREKDAFIPLEIDGGVNDTNVMLATAAGVNRFISTGFIFDSTEPEERYQTLLRLIKEELP